MKKALTYAEFIELAKANYNKGGDGYVECWDDLVFDEWVRSFGEITKEDALKMFAHSADCENRAEHDEFDEDEVPAEAYAPVKTAENIVVIEDNAGWADIYACDGKTIYHANVGGEVYMESIIALLEGGYPIADGWDGEYVDAMDMRDEVKGNFEFAYVHSDYNVWIDTLPGSDITDMTGCTVWEGLNRAKIPYWMEETLIAKFGEEAIYGGVK